MDDATAKAKRNTLFLRIEPDTSGFKQLAKAELLIEQKTNDGDQFMASFGVQNWAPMALADGKLLLRDQTHMICVKVAN